MKNFMLSAIILSAGLAVFTDGAQAQGIKEGQWSMSMTTQMEGMDDEAAEAMEAMKNMSPEEKAMMEQMMGSMGMAAMMGAGRMTTTLSTCITNDDPVPQAEED